MKIDLEDWDKLAAQETCFRDVTTDTVMFSGGLGSGKTHYLCRKALKLSALNAGHPGGFLVPTYSDFKRDVKPEFEDILEEMGLQKNKHWWFHGTDKEYSFVWNRKPLYIFTGERSIKGPNLAYCLINEHSSIQFDRVKEMLRRVRVKDAPYRQKCLAGTPEDIFAWLEDFIEIQEERNSKKPDSFKIVYADTRENYHISDGYREELESMLDDQGIKVFAGGQIVKMGDNYFYYSFDKSKNVDESIVFDPEQIIHVGLDFNVGKMATSFSHKVMHNGQSEQHIFDEVLLKGDSNTYDISKAIKTRYPDHWKDKMIITCDASGAARSSAAKGNVKSDVGILRHEGLTVRHKSANTRLRKRQLLVNGLLYHNRIKINPKCKGVIKDFAKVRQNKIDFGKEKDKDHKLTHFSDGLDYLFDFEYKLPQDKNVPKVTARKR